VDPQQVSTLFVRSDGGQLTRAGTRYYYQARTGEGLDEFIERVADETGRLGNIPFVVSEKPKGTPVYAVAFCMDPLLSPMIPAEFWRT